MVRTITTVVKNYEYDDNGRIVKQTETIIEQIEPEGNEEVKRES